MEKNLKRKRLCITLRKVKVEKTSDVKLSPHIEGSDTWKTLPYHVFCSIFGELDLKDLAQCSRVCSDWLAVIKDDYFWKKLFRERWSLTPDITLRPCKDGYLPPTWLSEYRRLHLLEHGKPWVTHSTHIGWVDSLSFSHSGKYMCAATNDLITIWHIEDSERKRTNLLKKLIIGYNQDKKFNGITQTSFNSTDDLLLVSGVRMIPNPERPQEEYGELIYSFPELVPSRKIEYAGIAVNCISPTWFNSTSFITGDHDPEDYTITVITLHSVFTNKSRILLKSNIDQVRGLDVLFHPSTGSKMFVFSFADEDMSELEGPYIVSQADNNLSVYLVTSDCKVGPHACEASIEEGKESMKHCCIESKFTSSEIDHYNCSGRPKNTVCVKAAFLQVGGEIIPGTIGVVCRPYQSTPEGLRYSETQVDYRVFDLELNFLRIVVDLSPVVLPSHFLLQYLYQIHDQKYMIVNVCTYGNVSRIYDFHYKIFIIRQKRGYFSRHQVLPFPCP